MCCQPDAFHVCLKQEQFPTDIPQLFLKNLSPQNSSTISTKLKRFYCFSTKNDRSVHCTVGLYTVTGSTADADSSLATSPIHATSECPQRSQFPSYCGSPLWRTSSRPHSPHWRRISSQTLYSRLLSSLTSSLISVRTQRLRERSDLDFDLNSAGKKQREDFKYFELTLE